MLKRRIAMSLCGVIICAVAVGIFKIAALGVDPFQSFMSGMDKLIPIEFGTLYVIVNAVLLIFSLVTDRHNIGIATFINLFLLGYITQFTYDWLQTVIVEPSMVVRFLCLTVGIVVICFGSALYMTADLGVSTYDAVAIVLSGKWHLASSSTSASPATACVWHWVWASSCWAAAPLRRFPPWPVSAPSSPPSSWAR